MNKVAFTLAAICLALGAFAQGKPAAPKAPANAKKMTCAVMPANSVDIKSATAKHMYADYKGNRYFFCCEGCPETFKANPKKYAKSAHIKTPAKK